MKKLLILLVAAFALSLLAESAMAHGWRTRSVVAPTAAVDSVCSDELIAVYRHTLCGDYRQIGWICAESLCGEIPGDDYILVKKCFHKYYWVQICEEERVEL